MQPGPGSEEVLEGKEEEKTLIFKGHGFAAQQNLLENASWEKPATTSATFSGYPVNGARHVERGSDPATAVPAKALAALPGSTGQL